MSSPDMHRYEISIHSADTRKRTDDFVREQQKITKNVKRDIKSALVEKGLNAEFAYVAGHTRNVSRSMLILATDEVVAELRKVKNIDNIARR